jgi:inositol transport system ATP-binding protein
MSQGEAGAVFPASVDPMTKEYILQIRNLSMSFPGIQALSSVRLDVERGSVHALMGENGAGKSTLAKILAGFYLPDAGEILYRGRRIRFRGPHDALRQGISMIHQELLPFPDLTVTENIFMGRESASPLLGWLNKRQMNREAAQVLERLGVRLLPLKKMKELRVAEMQAVEIAKALIHRAEVIIMDEPTSAISQPEVEALFEVIRDLQRQHVAVIYISHRMDEVFRIADAVTILRDGCDVAAHPIDRLSPDRLIALMVGRELTGNPPPSSAIPGDVALRVSGLTRAGEFQDVHFEVRRGEILGIAGLMGAGRTELACALFGLAPPDAGEIQVQGRSLRIVHPRDALANGIAMVNEDRKGYGLVMKMSVKHNLTLASLRICCRRLWIDRRKENSVADDRIRAFSIRTLSRNQRVAYLSGGNQQKVVIAKALLSNPDVLILDEPTRGIDIGAKAEVFAIIRGLAEAGKAVIMISSELPEILSLSTRILVMQEGRITAQLDPRQTTQEEIMRYAMPGRKGRKSDA